MSFSGSVAVVTGGGGGIGRATAEAFAAQGLTVVIADVDEAGMDETVRRIGASGGKARARKTDVSVAGQVAALIATTVSAHGSVDYMFNNAGISGFTGGPMADMDESVFDRVLAVNIKGVWLGMKYAIPVMVRQGSGVIVNTASTLGLVGQRHSGPYSATKHAVIGLTKTAAIEYGTQNVRVNAVCPGGTETPITAGFRATFTDEAWRARNLHSYPATARYSTAEEIAAAVLYLCSDEASGVHGIALPVDGAYTAQ